MAAVPLIECKLKGKCPNKTDGCLATCWNPDCDGHMHKGCSDLLLNKCSIAEDQRPTLEDASNNGDPIVFCKKACYNKWIATKNREAKLAAKAEKVAIETTKKKRVTWEEDGSLDTLMEWLTTEGNYADYCGSKIGKTKTQHHKELSLLLREKNTTSDRTEKDVENKITGLERQFRIASDWANNTGAGVDNPGVFETALLKRRPLCRQLEPVMGDRPNAKPLATNEDSDTDLDAVDAAGGDLEDDDDDSGMADMGAVKAISNATQEETPPKTSSVSSGSTGKSTGSGTIKRRMTAGSKSNNNNKTAAKKGKPGSADDVLSSHLGMDDTFTDLRRREVIAREREANARWLEAEANSAKTKTENSILSIQAKATLLRERKSPLDDGISQEEVDQLLPLPKPWLNCHSNC